MKDGIINVYKEKDYTSFDVVAILRKVLQTKKIGHTGTLDPQAEGVLPICIGKATKAVDYLTNKEKIYATTFLLGISTDTQDHTGQVIKTGLVQSTPEEILQVINGFVGPYSQIPPMFSALKVNGKKLYELAREGKTIDRKPRDIFIKDITDVKIQEDRIFMRVSCSKGTYIRTLCHDIGEKLGCGAHMTSLVREKSGHFEIENSLNLEAIRKMVDEQTIENYILSTDKIFSEYQQVLIAAQYNKELYNGNKLKKEFLDLPMVLEVEKTYRVYDFEQHFIGLYRYIANHDGEYQLKPVTLFI